MPNAAPAIVGDHDDRALRQVPKSGQLLRRNK
jgi:hypothetical protein